MKSPLFPFVCLVAGFVTFLGFFLFAAELLLAGYVGAEYLRTLSRTGARWVWSPNDLMMPGTAAGLVLASMLFALTAGGVKLLSPIESNPRPETAE